jgi:hypothetical protein
MRLYSTLESSNRGEITVLAIIETLLSVALYVGIAYWFDTVRHIVIAAVLAPLWLLRTRGSVRLGVKWYLCLHSWTFSPSDVMDKSISWRLYVQFLDRFERFGTLLWYLLFPVMIILFPVMIIVCCLTEALLTWVIRACATVVSITRHPLVHLVAIRQNWKRLVLATDIGTLPELLPGAESNPVLRNMAMLSSGHILSGMKMLLQVPILLAISAFTFLFLGGVLLLYIVPMLLRTAIKGVSILYAPLFFVINSDPINKKLDLGTRLVEMQHNNTALLKRAVAFFAIGSFLLTLLLSSLVQRAHDWIRPEATPVFILLVEYYFPPTLKAWQLASAVNGVLVLYLSWIYAPQAARRLERGIWQPSEVRTYLNRWIGVQMVLSIYSVICAVALFANFLLHHQFPARHWQWFPTVGM